MGARDRLKRKLGKYTTKQLNTLVRTMSERDFKREIAAEIVDAREGKLKSESLNQHSLFSVALICKIEMAIPNQAKLADIHLYVESCSNEDLIAIRDKAKWKAIRKFARRVYAKRNPPNRQKRNVSRPQRTLITYNTILNSPPSRRSSAPRSVQGSRPSREPIFVKSVYFKVKLDGLVEPTPLTELERKYQMPDDSNRPRWS